MYLRVPVPAAFLMQRACWFVVGVLLTLLSDAGQCCRHHCKRAGPFFKDMPTTAARQGSGPECAGSWLADVPQHELTRPPVSSAATQREAAQGKAQSRIESLFGLSEVPKLHVK